MTVQPVDPNKDGTYEIRLGSTFDDVPRQSLHALKYNFKPAAIDYSQMGNLTSVEDGSGEVSLALPSTSDGEYHIFKGPLQEAKANEFVLVFDPETNTFVLERLTSLSRLSATRTSRTNTLNGSSAPAPPSIPISTERPRSKSSDDIPTISLDPPTSSNIMDDIDIDINTSEPDEPSLVPAIVTPRLPPVSPMQSRHHHRRREQEEIESSDDDSDINIDVSKPRSPPQHTKPDPDEDVSDEDLDDLANELESSLENRPGSSSSDADSDFPGPPKAKAPDFNNVPRSGGPISMSRFAGGNRRRDDESSSSESSDDED